MGVQEEVVVGEGKLSELDKKLSGCKVCGGRPSLRKCSRQWEWGMLCKEEMSKVVMVVPGGGQESDHVSECPSILDMGRI